MTKISRPNEKKKASEKKRDRKKPKKQNFYSVLHKAAEAKVAARKQLDGKSAPKGSKAAAIKALHPNSRRAKRVRQESRRIENKDKKKIEKNQGNRVGAGKFNFFKDKLEEKDYKILTDEEMVEIARIWIDRSDEELKVLEEKRRGRPEQTGRERELRSLKEEETKQLQTSTFEAPDCTTKATCNAFKLWDGRSLSTLRGHTTKLIGVAQKKEALGAKRKEKRFKKSVKALSANTKTAEEVRESAIKKMKKVADKGTKKRRSEQVAAARMQE